VEQVALVKLRAMATTDFVLVSLLQTPLSTKVGTKFRRQVAVVSRYSSLAD
jgi:hypothetical protein